MQELIRAQLTESMAVKQRILDDAGLIEAIAALAERCAATLRQGHKILIAGNGGSAADAQHIAAELSGRFKLERPGLAGLALTTDTSLLTAVGNDYGFDAIFARQIEALGQAGDLFIGISTSGNSANVLKALAVCADKGVQRIGLCGGTGGKMAEACELCITVPSADTPRIQESHIAIGHILCALIEQQLFAAAE